MKALFHFGDNPKHLPLENRNGQYTGETVFRKFCNPVSSIDGLFYPNGTDKYQVDFLLKLNKIKRVWNGRIHGLISGYYSCTITEQSFRQRIIRAKIRKYENLIGNDFINPLAYREYSPKLNNLKYKLESQIRQDEYNSFGYPNSSTKILLSDSLKIFRSKFFSLTGNVSPVNSFSQ